MKLKELGTLRIGNWKLMAKESRRSKAAAGLARSWLILAILLGGVILQPIMMMMLTGCTPRCVVVWFQHVVGIAGSTQEQPVLAERLRPMSLLGLILLTLRAILGLWCNQCLTVSTALMTANSEGPTSGALPALLAAAAKLQHAVLAVLTDANPGRILADPDDRCPGAP